VACKQKPEFALIGDDYLREKGFTLQRFDVIEPQLDSLIHSVVIKTEQDMMRVNILELIFAESELNFVFCTSIYKDMVSKHHIFGNNKRIVGYIETSVGSMIVLSNVSEQLDFGYVFYKFIRPTDDKKVFDYIYFPDDLYCLTDEKGIPCPPLLYDPIYYWYIFNGGKFEFVNNNK
jgi:hypothetical protein